MKKELDKIVKSAKDFINYRSEKNLGVNLIKGTYAPADAADILLSFINDKIKFHTVKKLHLRNDSPHNHESSDLRIEELRDAKRQITNLVLEARSSGMVLEIDSTIEITLKPQKA